jgi:hypothetical protein
MNLPTRKYQNRNLISTFHNLVYIIAFFIIIIFINSCGAFDRAIATVNNNVCKRLRGKVVLYAVFVDTRYTQPWTEYDISSTLDSIKRATKWIEAEAEKNGVSVEIDVETNQNGKIIPISYDFPRRTLSGTLFSPTISFGIPKLDRWADAIAKKAGQNLPQDTSKVIRTKNRMNDRERLIARLRDINKTDNVALIYFVNNYYKDELSVTIHTASVTDIEYSIVSFKDPSVITHEFLHLFGALDLYINPLERKHSQKMQKLAMNEFPDEIMAFTYRDLSQLEISPFTKYLIGWSNQLDDKYSKMLLGRKIKPLRY